MRAFSMRRAGNSRITLLASISSSDEKNYSHARRSKCRVCAGNSKGGLASLQPFLTWQAARGCTGKVSCSYDEVLSSCSLALAG